MKKQEVQQQNIEPGRVFQLLSPNKQNKELHSIYIAWVNQLKLRRDKEYNGQPVEQYLKMQYPPNQENDLTEHTKISNCKTIFDIMERGGCSVSFISQEDQKKRQNQEDYEELIKLDQKELENKAQFFKRYHLAQRIQDCYIIYHQDVGGQVNMRFVFRDQNWWYMMETDRVWPGYEY